MVLTSSRYSSSLRRAWRDSCTANILDQDVTDTRDSTICKISTLLAPINFKFSQDNCAKFLKKYKIFDFGAANRPLATLEEGADVLEDIVDGLLHLEGEGVTVVPENNEEEALGEV